MDARDIKEPVPEVQDGKYLEKIYDLQKELINHYVKIEGLPNYPIDVNTKKNQVLIKDFVGRVIEELGEGYESMLLIKKLSILNRTWCWEYDSYDADQCINHLQNVSEEMADAMHFMTELLIYVNIQPKDILDYIKVQVQVGNDTFRVLHEHQDNILKVAMAYGISKHLENDNIEAHYSKIDLFEIAKDGIDLNLYQAAHKYNPVLYSDFKKCLWDVTYHLNIARNFLKNKPWKQSQMMTDEIKFQKEIVEAFICMMGAFAIIDITPETLFYIYFKKNRANAFRIRSNY